jgi:addiction module HigA family antidote
MSSTTYPYRPDYAVGPGEVLAEHLESMGLTPDDVARRAGLDRHAVEAVLAGEAAIDTEIAQRLDAATGLGAEIWLALDARWRGRTRPGGAGDRAPAVAHARR